MDGGGRDVGGQTDRNIGYLHIGKIAILDFTCNYIWYQEKFRKRLPYHIIPILQHAIG